MLNNKPKQKNNSDDVYLTQKELAKRWRVTESTIKNIRDNGGIDHFFPPNSSRVLYPINGVIRVERELLISNKKEDHTLKRKFDLQMKEPAVSPNSDKKWEI